MQRLKASSFFSTFILFGLLFWDVPASSLNLASSGYQPPASASDYLKRRAPTGGYTSGPKGTVVGPASSSTSSMTSKPRTADSGGLPGQKQLRQVAKPVSDVVQSGTEAAGKGLLKVFQTMDSWHLMGR